MLKLLSALSLLAAIFGIVGLLFGIINSGIGLALISVVVIILGVFGWYVFKNIDAGVREESKRQNTGSR